MVDWTIKTVLEWTESYFKNQSNGNSSHILSQPSNLESKVDSPRLTAEILLAHTLGLKRLDLYLQHDRPLEKQELSEFKRFIQRRKAGEPVAYITRIKGFYESEFHVEPGVLIPRPDTETLVEESLKVLKAHKNGSQHKVLELGAGSGAVVASLAKAAPEHLYFANDISGTTLKVARQNSRKISNDQVCFFAGSWLAALKPGPVFDLILSNPPYIPSGDIDGLQSEIKLFEPKLALDGGVDGLECYREIIDQAHFYLVPGGVLLLEIGYDQKAGINRIFSRHNQYNSMVCEPDLAGHDRVVKITKKY